MFTQTMAFVAFLLLLPAVHTSTEMDKFSDGMRPENSMCYVHNSMGSSTMGNKGALSQSGLEIEVDEWEGLKLDGFYYESESTDESWSRVSKILTRDNGLEKAKDFAKDIILNSCYDMQYTTYPLRAPYALPVFVSGETAIGLKNFDNFNISELVFKLTFNVWEHDPNVLVRHTTTINADQVAVFLDGSEKVLESVVFVSGYSNMGNTTFNVDSRQYNSNDSDLMENEYCAMVRLKYNTTIMTISLDYSLELIELDNIFRSMVMNVTGIPTGGQGLPNIVTDCVLKSPDVDLATSLHYDNDTVMMNLQRGLPEPDPTVMYECPDKDDFKWYVAEDVGKETRGVLIQSVIRNATTVATTTTEPPTTNIITTTTTTDTTTDTTASTMNSTTNETTASMAPDNITTSVMEEEETTTVSPTPPPPKTCMELKTVRPFKLPKTYDQNYKTVMFSYYSGINRSFVYDDTDRASYFTWDNFCSSRHDSAIKSGVVYLTAYPYWRYMVNKTMEAAVDTKNKTIVQGVPLQKLIKTNTVNFFEVLRETHCNTWEDLSLILSAKLYLDALQVSKATSTSEFTVLDYMFYMQSMTPAHEQQKISLQEILDRHPDFKPLRPYRRPGLTIKSLTYLNCQKPIDKEEQKRKAAERAAKKRARRSVETVADHSDQNMLCAMANNHEGTVGDSCNIAPPSNTTRTRRAVKTRARRGLGDFFKKGNRLQMGPGGNADTTYSAIRTDAGTHTSQQVNAAFNRHAGGVDISKLSNDKQLDMLRKIKHDLNGGSQMTGMDAFRQKYPQYGGGGGLAAAGGGDLVYSTVKFPTGAGAAGGDFVYSTAGFPQGAAGGAMRPPGELTYASFEFGGGAGGAAAARGGAGGSSAIYGNIGGGESVYGNVDYKGRGMLHSEVTYDSVRTGGGSDVSQRLNSHYHDQAAMGGGTCGGRMKRSVGGMCGLRRDATPFSGNGDGLGGKGAGGNPLAMDADGSPNLMRVMDPDGDGMPGIGQAGLAPGGGNMLATAGAIDPMAMMAGGMMMTMMSTSMSASNTRSIDNILTNKYASVNKDLAVTLASLDKLNEFGSMMALGGGMAALMTMNPAALVVAGIGLAIQIVTSIVTFAIQIYQIRFPTNPPRDELLEKYSEYRKLLLADAAGNRWCMMPESKLDVTLAFFNHSVHNDNNRREEGKKTTSMWTPAGETRIKVLYNPLITFNAALRVTCAGDGVLRFNEFNSKVARKQSVTETGTSVWDVTQIASMVAAEPVIHGRCGEVSNLIIEREYISETEMVLLQKRGPGEPGMTTSMPSDVCDLFPFKRFYVSMPSCSFEPGEQHVGWTSCSMMFKRAVWNPINATWMVPNPFAPRGSDRKIFTFSRRDFRDYMPIRPNEIAAHKQLCSNAIKPGLCRLPEIFGVEDTANCNNKVRFFRVYMAKPVNASLDGSIQGYMMTCQPGSQAKYIVKRGTSENMHMVNLDNSGYSRTFFLKDTEREKKPILWIFCQHVSMPSYKSDVIELMLDDTDASEMVVQVKTDTYAFSEDWTESIMYGISKIGPGFSPGIQDFKQNRRKVLPEYKRFFKHNDIVHMELNAADGGENFDSKETFKFKTEIGLGDLDDHFGEYLGEAVGSKWWGWAMRGCKATSSMQLNIGFCSVNDHKLDFDPMGWFQTSWLDMQKGIGTLAAATNIWHFKVRDGFDTLKLKKDDGQTYTYTHKLKKCAVHLDLVTKMLKIDCPESDMSVDDLRYKLGDKDKTHGHMCFSVSPAKDGCVRENVACGTRSCEWKDLDYKRNYWMGTWGYYMYTPWYSWAYGSEPQIAIHTFCQDEGVYNQDIDGEWRYTALMYHKTFDYTPLVEESYQSGNRLGPDDLVIEAKKYKKMEDAKDAVGKIYDLINDPMVKAVNSMASGMTKEGREIARINIPHDFVLESEKQRQAQIAVLEDEVNSLMMDLMVDALSDSIWYKEQIEHTQKKCCRLSLEQTKTMYQGEYYDDWKLNVQPLDPNYAFFKCPRPHAFYQNYNYSSGKIWSPHQTYELPQNIHRYLKSKDETYWITCMNNQEIIFENENVEKQFNASLYEELFERERFLALRQLENNMNYARNISDDLNKVSWFRRYGVRMITSQDDEHQETHARAKRALGSSHDHINPIVLEVYATVDVSVIVGAVAALIVLFTILLVAVIKFKKDRNAKISGERRRRRVGRTTEKLGLKLLDCKKRLDCVASLWYGKEDMARVLTQHVDRRKNFKKWASGTIMDEPVAEQFEVEVLSDEPHPPTKHSVEVQTQNNEYTDEPKNTETVKVEMVEIQGDDDDDENYEDIEGAECIELLNIAGNNSNTSSRTDVSNGKKRSTLDREGPAMGPWANKPMVAPKYPTLKHFHLNG
ncbi:membrane protein [Cyprinid herpesvirus 2]|nr:membrane protein [Cyprinid herpesvirus 2]